MVDRFCLPPKKTVFLYSVSIPMLPLQKHCLHMPLRPLHTQRQPLRKTYGYTQMLKTSLSLHILS